MKGRKPKPTGLRLIEGNREHRTIHAELEPRPVPARPPKPPFLNKAGQQHWNYLVRHLQCMNTLAGSDQGIVMGAAMAYGQASDLQERIAWLMNPANLVEEREKELASARRLLNSTLANLVRFEAELGLNPTARTRIRLEKPAAVSRKDKLLA